MAYKISFITFTIAVVSAGDVSESTSSSIVPCASENRIIPAADYTSIPVPQYASPTLHQVKEPSLQPATYILQQVSAVKPTLVFQQAAQVLEQAEPLLQQVPILQYAVRIAVPQPLHQQYVPKPVSVEEEQEQTFKNHQILPKVQQERNSSVIRNSAAQVQPEAGTHKSQHDISYSAEEENTLVKYNEAITATPLNTFKDDFDNNPQYVYGYDIVDTHTGDSKRQIEQRQGDLVRGTYSLIDPDGHRRTVDYTADTVNGFRAVVRREPVNDKDAKYERNSRK